MKYIDRKGNITIEENEQDKFLRHLYNDWGGAALSSDPGAALCDKAGRLVFKYQVFCRNGAGICTAKRH